jgi:hypothetical protein
MEGYAFESAKAKKHLILGTVCTVGKDEQAPANARLSSRNFDSLSIHQKG